MKNVKPPIHLNSNQVLDESGTPLLGYHGTFQSFDQFDSSRSNDGLIFFTTEKGFAIDWLEDRKNGSEGFIISAHLYAKAAWDYLKEEHVNLLLREMVKRNIKPVDENLFEEGIWEGDWMIIEKTHGLVQLINDLGFDAFYITEGSDMDRNIAVFNHTQISIINRETLEIRNRRRQNGHHP